MSSSKAKKLLLVFSIFLIMALPALAATAEENAAKFGILTIIPPLVAITLAFLTKNVVISLFLGILSGTYIISLYLPGGFFSNLLALFTNLVPSFLKIVDLILGSLSDPWNAGVILQCTTIGGLIALITYMGGARAIAESLAKRAKTARSAQIVAWLMGLFVFFDDYANSLIVGPIMRPVTDKLNVSREKLAFIIDATAAPVAGIAIISTWVGYEMSLIKSAYASIGQPVNAYMVFINTLPFRFYNIFMLFLVFATAFFLRESGPMLKAERRARKGELLAPNARPMSTEGEERLPEGKKSNIWNAIVPILVLVLASFIGFYSNGYSAIMNGDNTELITLLQNAPLSLNSIREAFSASDASIVLFQSALFASIVAMIMGVSQKIFTVSKAIDTFITGLKSMVITAVILLLAWSLSGVIKELGTATYLVSLLSDKIPAFTLPTIIFVLGSIISFATGTSYGTMGILMPLAIPMAFGINPDPTFVLMSAGAVLTGAIFGDHCSPISDTTILSSMGAACDHIDHVNTQIWYALAIAFISIVFGYLPISFGLNVWVALLLGLAAVVALLYLFGEKVELPVETSKKTSFV